MSEVTFSTPKNIGMGYNTKSQGEGSVASGYYTAATNDYSVAIGSKVSSTHKNAVILGTNISSRNDNSTLLNQGEFREDGLHINGGTSIISDEKCEEKCSPHRCTACNNSIMNGVTWIKKGYKMENRDDFYEDITLGLCFNCILDCVLEFKAKMMWNKDVIKDY